MTQNDFKYVDPLFTYYIKAYESKYKKKPIVNRNKVKFLLVEMLKDVSFKDAKRLVDYYIKLYHNPDLADLCYKYDDVLKELNKEERDFQESKDLKRHTQSTVADFRRRFNKSDQ